MTRTTPAFKVDVDMTNPGQAIACCGLLELSHRLWPGVEGWFEASQFSIDLQKKPCANPLVHLVKTLGRCDISGLTVAEREERDELERRRRELKKIGKELPSGQEERRTELGRLARVGEIRIGTPFFLLLDWWNTKDDAVPKTWAGRQELHRIARSAQEAISGFDESGMATILDVATVLREASEYRESQSLGNAVEPFYFDARRFAHRLDVGFSLDALELETSAYPVVELLCLIGLQRFRPAATPDEERSFDYCTWSSPLSVQVAAAVFGCVSPFPRRQRWRFHLRVRDDQKRYKAFGLATLISEVAV